MRIGLGSSVLIVIVFPPFLCCDVVTSCPCWASSSLSSTDLVIPPNIPVGLVVALQGSVVIPPCLDALSCHTGYTPSIGEARYIRPPGLKAFPGRLRRLFHFPAVRREVNHLEVIYNDVLTDIVGGLVLPFWVALEPCEGWKLGFPVHGPRLPKISVVESKHIHAYM